MASRREKQGLRPVQDVAHRLRHDPAFDAARFQVTYEERFAGERSAPLLDFVAGGEIPWHRIQSVRAGPLIVWDRRARIDLVFGSGESEAADHPAILRACAAPEAPAAAPERGRRGRGRGRAAPSAAAPAAPAHAPAGAEASFTPRACWRFHPGRGAWEAIDAAAAPPVVVEALGVVTYNVLVDLHEAERIYSERRAAAALALLRERDADVIALQEVTPRFWAALLAEEWVRAGYYVSSGTGAEGLEPYGQALLSRWPLALSERRLSPRKALLAGRLDLAGRPLLIVAVHLTSNFRGDAGARRAEQLAVVAERVAAGDVADALVLGDLNFGDDADEAAENQRLADAGLVDVWASVHPGEPGHTFDPGRNPLAAIMSRRGRASRFDRVLVRSPAGALAPIAITRFGDRPFAHDGDEARFASDHDGLAALLEVRGPAPAGVIDAAPVHTSALVILPPAAAWPAIQAIRAELDPSYGRWMPHVNLIYGFVPEDRFAEAAAAIAGRLRGRPPIPVRLGGLRRFDHRGSTTLWIEPECDPPGALRELQAELQALFPACREQSGRGPGGYTPHLTIARVSGDEAAIAAAIERLRSRLPAAAWTVDAVHLISRRGGEPFAVRHTLSLGTGHREAGDPLVAPPPGAAWPSRAHEGAAATIAAACAEALGGAARVHLVGSARLGVAAADADLDLVCVHEGAAAAPHARVQEALAGRGPLAARTAVSAGLVALRGEFTGVRFDLLFAAVPPELLDRDPGALTADELAGVDEASRRALLGCVDADALVRLAGPAADALRGALARVRRWTRARALEGGAWGLLGGYTWAILVAVAARDAALEDMSNGTSSSISPWTIVRRFFAAFAAWPAGAPVIPGARPGPGAAGRRAPWPIFTPTAPAFNSARGLLPSTLALLQAELRRGAAVVDAAADEDAALAALCAPEVAGGGPAVEVIVQAADPAALAEARGLVDGQALGLLRALEAAGAALRPYGWSRRGPAWVARVGLRGGEAGALRRVVDDAVAGLRGGAGWPAGATIDAALLESAAS